MKALNKYHVSLPAVWFHWLCCVSELCCGYLLQYLAAGLRRLTL